MPGRGRRWDKDSFPGEGLPHVPACRAGLSVPANLPARWGANPPAPQGNPKSTVALRGQPPAWGQRGPHGQQDPAETFAMGSASFRGKNSLSSSPYTPRNPPVPALITSIWQQPGADCRLLKEKALCASAGWKRRRFNNSALFSRNSSAEIPSPHAGENKRLGRSQSDAAARGCGGEGGGQRGPSPPKPRQRPAPHHGAQPPSAPQSPSGRHRAG